MNKPNIQIDGVVREMTDEEFAALVENGWRREDPNDPANQ